MSFRERGSSPFAEGRILRALSARIMVRWSTPTSLSLDQHQWVCKRRERAHHAQNFIHPFSPTSAIYLAGSSERVERLTACALPKVCHTQPHQVRQYAPVDGPTLTLEDIRARVCLVPFGFWIFFVHPAQCPVQLFLLLIYTRGKKIQWVIKWQNLTSADNHTLINGIWVVRRVNSAHVFMPSAAGSRTGAA